MLSTPKIDLAFDNDDWTTPQIAPKLYRSSSSASSVSSWGVTSIGRGFEWDQKDDENSLIKSAPPPKTDKDDYRLAFDLNSDEEEKPRKLSPNSTGSSSNIMRPVTNVTPITTTPTLLSAVVNSGEPFYMSPTQSRSTSPIIHSPVPSSAPSSSSPRPHPSRTPSTPRPRRRSSQQRVSLVAGRVLIAPRDTPTQSTFEPHYINGLQRANSSSSFLSVAASTRAPSPTSQESFLGNRKISEFEIEGEIGRGAYGLVKRAREKLETGSLGPPLVIKQIIKSRILADCWKKHPKYGTIPIEIYVMSAISNTSYVLPARRPWNPLRSSSTDSGENDWLEGKVVRGHPNICPLLDFFEDNHYYYLVLPSTTPETKPGVVEGSTSDLFDLVESFPHGLPPNSIRTYLGQIADALCFLHSHGIVHRDIKDENVVLGPYGRCILIDFGSSGLIKKNGWDSFSGTLDYAGPEILRGERYHGKEQDVWAFGVVAYVLLVGECPFMTAEEAQDGLESPFANASIALDDRCAEDKELEGEEADGGGALGDAAALVRACLRVEVAARPTFETILQSRFLCGNGGWKKTHIV
ncbi:kinase-like domain-containing protein [Lentinula aciculospora]|uniref:Kinase-like domain-containing protein n=1 Tax=Lentinula aciculospora TaxID=153920 RepID=A0A9W9AQP9_9AGAR|nr:kinase-like domain-containing protein [Lentinula aciculospora]